MKNAWEKFFSAPSEVLEKGVEAGRMLECKLKGVCREKHIHAASKFWHTLGPGLTTGAADDDPSGIATYSQMGASQGFGLIWLSLWSLPLMTIVQEMCARIGIATGVGLAANIKRHYSPSILHVCTFLLLAANVFNIGADLGAMAQSAQLIAPRLSFTLLLLFFALLSLFLQIFISYKEYAKYLKYLTFVLFTYIASALLMDLDWGAILGHVVVPAIGFSKDALLLVCAALGTTISPYLFFWQSSQEVEEQILHGERTEAVRRAHATERDMKTMRADVFSGMFVSNLVMFFIIAACAATLYQNGITSIDTAAEAALALRPFAGEFAFTLFTLGIVGTGLLAIPVLAGSASYAISESFGWKTGLYRKLKQATAFYGVIIVSVLLGMLLNFTGLDPMKTLIYSAVFNGIVSPFMIFFILRLSSDERVMGKFKNGRASALIGWITFALITVSALGALLSAWAG